MALSNNEKWCAIKNYPNYEISNKGEIKSNITGKKLCQKIDRGYNRVRLYHDGKSNYKSVHRLVAESFLENPLDKKELNHIDGNKQNNSIENLEWSTRSENMKHAFNTNLKKPSGGLPNRKIKVIETNKTYASAYECARDMKLDQAHINHCLTGKRSSHKGYHFEYA